MPRKVPKLLKLLPNAQKCQKDPILVRNAQIAHKAEKLSKFSHFPDYSEAADRPRSTETAIKSKNDQKCQKLREGAQDERTGPN